jgi:hypothetical protein
VRSLFSVSIVAAIAALAVAATASGNPSATIVGAVTLTAADGGTFAGSGARVVLACRTDRTTRIEIADEHGAFRFLNVPVDTCSIEADVQGFTAQPAGVVTAAGQIASGDLHLGISPLRVGVTVRRTAPDQGPTILSRSDRGRPTRAQALQLRSLMKEDCCHVTAND